jgi:signal transduction histidine kinase
MDRLIADALGQDAEHLAGEERRRLLARLLGRMAHEIRNPLSSLNIHVQLLEEDLARLPAADKEATAARLEIIQGELHRLENLVKHFLRLGRPTDLDPAPVELGRLVKHVCELLRPEAQNQETELTSRVEQPLPALQADANQLTQALVNLVINALQAVGREGRVEVRVFAAPPQEEVTLEVRDSGPGIAPDKLNMVFDPYYTTKEEGSGLGLWIAQQIASAHQGTLRVGNLPGGGALFTLKLPVLRKELHGG